MGAIEQAELASKRAITMDSVESSQIHGIGYDAATNTLVVRFKSKAGLPAALYEYSNVTAEDFAAFKGAESIGSHFYKHIKPHKDKYPFVCIEKMPATDEEWQ
jgi:hypothetical protein